MSFLKVVTKVCQSPWIASWTALAHASKLNPTPLADIPNPFLPPITKKRHYRIFINPTSPRVSSTDTLRLLQPIRKLKPANPKARKFSINSSWITSRRKITTQSDPSDSERKQWEGYRQKSPKIMSKGYCLRRICLRIILLMHILTSVILTESSLWLSLREKC